MQIGEGGRNPPQQLATAKIGMCLIGLIYSTGKHIAPVLRANRTLPVVSRSESVGGAAAGY
jgi:hypothetical protein